MKHARKLFALLLSMLLLLALLPATAAADGSDLRAVAVARAEAIATVPWTLEERIAKGSITGTRLTYFNDNGIFPTTYFEYDRLHFPIRGVMVEANTGSLEKFKTQIDESASIVPGYGHIHEQPGYVGMDQNAFLADVLAQVSPRRVDTLRQALTDDSLQTLLSGADLSAASSRAAIGGADVKAAYAKLQTGDLLLAWDNGADVNSEPKIHAMVVKSADAARGEATVIYLGYNLLLWNFKCSKCGATDAEGPTSAALPVHVNSNADYTFGSFKTHADTDPSSGCSGRWEPTYASNWHVDTVTFDQLAGAGGQKAPDGSRGYLPYTLKAYAAAPVPAEVKVSNTSTPESVVGGLRAAVSSNYRISSFEAVLTKKGGQSRSFVSVPGTECWDCEYADPALDLALLACEPGEYHLTLDVYSGPVTDTKSMKPAPVRAVEIDFALSKATMKIALDKTAVPQGSPLGVSVSAIEAGFTGVRAVLSYDRDYWTFDAAASKSENPKLSFTDNGDGTVTMEYYGAALPAGASAGKYIFKAVRTGAKATPAEKTGPFYLSGLYASKKEGAKAEDLAGSRPDTTPLKAGVGLNTVIYKNYAGGNDLILVFMCTPEMTVATSDSSIAMTYAGQPMIDVSGALYRADDSRFIRTYAWITAGASSERVAVGSTKCAELKYDNDVNQSGWVDANDALAIDNIIRGKMPLEGNMTRWLQADINRDGRVDAADVTALVDTLMK